MTWALPPAAASRTTDPGVPNVRDRGDGEREWVVGVLRALTPMPEATRWRWIGRELVAGSDVQSVLRALWRHRALYGGDPGQLAATVTLLAGDEAWASAMVVDGPVAVALRLASGRGLDLLDHGTLVERFTDLPRAVAAAIAVNPRLRRRPELAAALIGPARRVLPSRTVVRMLPALSSAHLGQELPELQHLPGLEWTTIACGRARVVLRLTIADLDDTPVADRDRWWDERGFPALVGVVRADRSTATAVLDFLDTRAPVERAPVAWLWRADLVHAAPAAAASYLLARSRRAWLARHRPSRSVARVLTRYGAHSDWFGSLRRSGRRAGTPVRVELPEQLALPDWGATRRTIVDLARTRHDLVLDFLAHVHAAPAPSRFDLDDSGRWRSHHLPTATWVATQRQVLADALTCYGPDGDAHLRPDPTTFAIAGALPEVPTEALLGLLDGPATAERHAALAARRHQPEALLEGVLLRLSASGPGPRVHEVVSVAKHVAPARAAELLEARRDALPATSAGAVTIRQVQGDLQLLPAPRGAGRS